MIIPMMINPGILPPICYLFCSYHIILKLSRILPTFNSSVTHSVLCRYQANLRNVREKPPLTVAEANNLNDPLESGVASALILTLGDQLDFYHEASMLVGPSSRTLADITCVPKPGWNGLIVHIDVTGCKNLDHKRAQMSAGLYNEARQNQPYLVATGGVSTAGLDLFINTIYQVCFEGLNPDAARSILQQTEQDIKHGIFAADF